MRYLLSILVVIFMCACTEICHVQGHIAGMEEDTYVCVLRRVSGSRYDTIQKIVVRKGNFQFDLTEEFHGDAYELQIGKHPARALFFAEKGVVHIEGHVDSLFYSRASGTRGNNEWQAYQRYTLELSERREQEMFAPEIQTLEEEQKKMRQKVILKKYGELMIDYQDSLIGDGNSLAALYSFWKRHLSMDADEIDTLLEKFSKPLSANRYYVDMKNRADVLRRIAPGAMAPVFTAKTWNGDTLSIADLRGKYLILDFWASWCIPCRAETVHIKKLYHQYHNRGLDVFSVSSDKDENAWRKAIEQDQMVWNQGILLGKNKVHVYELYGIVGIPAIWVIDPDGKIIAKNLRGENLKDFCARLFD